MRRIILVLVSAVGLLLPACSDSSDSAPVATVEPLDATPTTAEQSTDTSAGSESTTPIVEPITPSIDGPIAGAVDLALGWMNGEPVTEADYEEFLAPVFKEQLPLGQFIAVMAQLSAAAPWTLVEELGVSPAGFAGTVTDRGGDRFELTVALEDPSQIQINLLLVQPAYVAPASADEAVDQLSGLGAFRFTLADTASGGCDPIESGRPDELMPLGSVFKLYVLDALVDEVANGRVRWDDSVSIDDSLDSLPSGTTQNEAAGSTLTVRELAERMISISDNTATDHLMVLVGRETVEQAVERSGHSDPAANLPFLTTRELFILKYGDPAVRSDYLAADIAGRRALLDGAVRASPLPRLDGISAAPVAIDTLEWFASPADICRLLLGLAEDEAAREILSINPGVPDTGAGWSFIGFKGGSEPGVAAASWLVEDSDGQQYVFAGGVANESTPFNPDHAVRTMAVLRDELTAG